MEDQVQCELCEFKIDNDRPAIEKDLLEGWAVVFKHRKFCDYCEQMLIELGLLEKS